MNKVSSKLQLFVSIIVLCGQVNLFSAMYAQTKTTSDLWGGNGELWDTRGRLSDFSYAGYGGGNAVKPNSTNIINVLENGVVINDGLSDVDAINAIINSAPETLGNLSNCFSKTTSDNSLIASICMSVGFKCFSNIITLFSELLNY